MTEARIVREALVVPVTDDPADVAAFITRESVTVSHHFPEADTQMRVSRLGVVIAISRPHGWD